MEKTVRYSKSFYEDDNIVLPDRIESPDVTAEVQNYKIIPFATGAQDLAKNPGMDFDILYKLSDSEKNFIITILKQHQVLSNMMKKQGLTFSPTDILIRDSHEYNLLHDWRIKSEINNQKHLEKMKRSNSKHLHVKDSDEQKYKLSSQTKVSSKNRLLKS